MILFTSSIIVEIPIYLIFKDCFVIIDHYIIHCRYTVGYLVERILYLAIGTLCIMSLIIITSFQVAYLNNNNNNNIVYAHLSSNITQTWTDRENNLKIQFSYIPQQPTMDDLIQLQFSIQNLQTGNHLKNLITKVTLINTSYNAIYKLGNIAVADGDFSIRCPSLDSGMHQVILKINSKDYSIASLASFNLSVLESSVF